MFKRKYLHKRFRNVLKKEGYLLCVICPICNYEYAEGKECNDDFILFYCTNCKNLILVKIKTGKIILTKKLEPRVYYHE